MMFRKKKDWELEVERILKEGKLNSRFATFVSILDKYEDEGYPPEEWQEVFDAFFEGLLAEYPAFACCILAFRAGMVWQKYQEELKGN